MSGDTCKDCGTELVFGDVCPDCGAGSAPCWKCNDDGIYCYTCGEREVCCECEPEEQNLGDCTECNLEN